MKYIAPELKYSEEIYKCLFEDSPISFFLMEMSGKFIDCNPAAEKIFGYTKEEYLGKDFRDFSFFPPKYEQVVIDAFKTLLKGKIPDPFEVQTYRKDRSLAWVRIQASIVKLSDKQLIQIISQDITLKLESEKK